MRIGLIYLGRRGSGGPITFELAAHLSTRASVFAMLSENIEGINTWRQSSLEFFTVPTYQSFHQAIFSLFRPGLFRRLASLIEERKPDVLIFPMFYTWNPFLQAHLKSIPGIVMVHDPVPHPGLESAVYRFLEDFSIRRANRWIAFSKSLVNELQKRGAAPGKIDVIPHGALSYYTQASPGRDPVSTGKVTLLFFGRITPYKGLEVLLKAFRQLKRPADVCLRIVGAGDLSPYRALFAGLTGVEIDNRWVSESEIDPIFRKASIVVLPYTSASQSGVVALAASYGLPVIATRTGGIPEQIIDGETGILVTPGDVQELSEAMERLISQPELAARIGRNLQRQYQDCWNWAYIADLLYRSCEKALGGI